MLDVRLFEGFSSLLPAIPILLAGVLFVAALVNERRREQRVRAWAAAVGWTYVGRDPSFVHRWRGEPFGIGSGRTADEVVTGLFQGIPALSFRYRYTTGSGKNRTAHTVHVAALALPAYLPTLELTPDGVGARIAKAFGGQDLRFESEAFNQVWRVEADQPKFAYDVLHPRLMERLLAPDATGMCLRIEGTDIVSWRVGSPDLDRLAPRLEVLRAVVAAVPPFVWQDHGYDPART